MWLVSLPIAIFSCLSGGTKVTGQTLSDTGHHAADPTHIVTQALVQVIPGPPKTLSIDH
jgi:hypothetical protein|tara:strand:- start:591 stop:767 length:177 start_codon:yes stop_codon:yes gene_type:complete